MVVQLPKLLSIHPQFTSHLYVRMRQVKLASRLDPRLQVCRYLCWLLCHTFGSLGMRRRATDTIRYRRLDRPQSGRPLFQDRDISLCSRFSHGPRALEPPANPQCLSKCGEPSSVLISRRRSPWDRALPRPPTTSATSAALSAKSQDMVLISRGSTFDNFRHDGTEPEVIAHHYREAGICSPCARGGRRIRRERRRLKRIQLLKEAVPQISRSDLFPMFSLDFFRIPKSGAERTIATETDGPALEQRYVLFFDFLGASEAATRWPPDRVRSFIDLLSSIAKIQSPKTFLAERKPTEASNQDRSRNDNVF